MRVERGGEGYTRKEIKQLLSGGENEREGQRGYSREGGKGGEGVEGGKGCITSYRK